MSSTPSRNAPTTANTFHNSNRGYSKRGRGGYRGNRGRGGRGRGHGSFTHYPRGSLSGTTHVNTRADRTPHGDMKTGLFKESFLEDPWAELMKPKGSQVVERDSGGAEAESGGEDSEGEIDLGEEFEGENQVSKDGGQTFGVGDGIIEAAQGVS